MIEQLNAKPGAIALRVHGHVSREDIDRTFDLLTEALQDHPKIDLFVEIDGLTGFDTEAIEADLKIAWSMLGKLDRFRRVAIVSDQAWIRWGSRLESALLPGISYRTYTRAEREQALAWVQGSQRLPYARAITIVPTTRADTIGIEVDGRISAEEAGEVARELNRLRHERPIKAILLRIRSIVGLEPSMVADGEYLRMKLGLMCDLDRYAVVGAQPWLVRWIELVRPLLRLEVRLFAENEENAAWAWLGAQPLSDRTAAA